MLNVVLSVMKINDFSICPRLYWYKYVLGQVPAEKPSFMDEGDIMHFGLNVYYEALAKGETPPPDTAIVEMMRNHATELSLEASLVESTCTDFLMHQNYYRGKETWKIEASEEPFAKILYQNKDVTIVLNGKTDIRVVTMGGNGPRALVDHKYLSQFREQSSRDNQPLAYCWAYEVNDFIFNRIGKQKSYSPDKRLQRPYINYSKFQIEEWKESAIEIALDIMKYEQMDNWPMRFTGCTLHGRKCTYHDVCNTTPDNRQYKLSEFITKESGRSVMDK